ncbi:MAG: DMT family transporter [Pseudomonadota bacterium]|nr:DMT family transporter [Pseudomonadota bacterium]
MTPAQIAGVMVVASGAAHAVVNAILKAGADKMSSRALIDGVSALILLPAAFFLPLPTGAWGWLAASGAIHLVYLVALIRTFEGADMMVAYPIFRGIAPALASIVAVAVFREPISLLVAIGVGLVSAGVLATALGRHMGRRTLAWSLLTGVTIALYTVVDAQGVRAAPSAPSYIVWIFLTIGGGVGGAFAFWRGPIFLASARAEWKAGLIAGVLSILTYGLALWAFRLGATPRLAALRETSILFGVLIAIVFLKERATPARLAGVAAILAGAVVLLANG